MSTIGPAFKVVAERRGKKKVAFGSRLTVFDACKSLEWNHEKCACDQQGSNALVMVFSFKLSTETRDMRRSQTKPAVHCFAGGRFMLPWMTQNDSHIVLTFFFPYPRDPFALDCHRHLPILKYGTVCMTNFQPAAPPRPRRAQGSPSQSEGFASSWIFGLLFTYGL